MEDQRAVREATVIAAYSAARAQGRTRYDAFVRAVAAYREQFPEPANPGPEVARILLATVQAGESTGLQPPDGMEYVEPA